MSPHVPPSDEVRHQAALDHVRSCDCPYCTMWVEVQRTIEKGTPTERLAAWRALTALLDDLAPRIVLDALGDV